MAPWQRLLAALAVAAVATLPVLSLAADIIVGGSADGWRPGVNYTEWAEGMEFIVGDRLIFSYPAGLHNVIAVDHEAFHSCSAPAGAHALDSGHDAVSLNSSGRKWYVCGKADHCSNGQKLLIDVMPLVTVYSTSTRTRPPSAFTPLLSALLLLLMP
ncbi:basic blue protein-like [Curcuma longa]|uniref:basic blue protein-like n=1 Tax=Curcuma longa TaxID=136217 RepID=UPI003D9F1B22